MFGSINTHNTIAQNKENAVLGSVARTGKTGLLSAKNGGSLHPSKTVGKPQKAFGSPRPSSVLTPSGKKAENKPLMRPALRSQAQAQARTPSSKLSQRSQFMTQEHAPKTIKRSQGLFSSRQQSRTDESLQLLEPEYVPPRPASPAFDAKGLVGFDLDISLVPVTQLSNSGAKLRELPPLDLNFEKLFDIPVSSPFKSQKSSIPRPCFAPSLDFVACKPQLLVANTLIPSRIPQLKRKRQL